MNSDSNFLRTAANPPLTTTGAPLLISEFDTNVINTYDDLLSLAVTNGVIAYDALTVYDDDVDSDNETFATYTGRLWQYVNIVPAAGATPVSGADWQEVFPAILAHEKNKDARFKKHDGFILYNDDQKINVLAVDHLIPGAKCQYVDTVTDDIYTAGVEDSSSLGAGFQSILYVFNPVALINYGVRIAGGQITIQHSDAVGKTAGITVEDGKILLETPDQLSTSITNGDILRVIDASTGEVEFYPSSWTLAGRPVSPIDNVVGLNTTSGLQEYWNGAAWITL